MEKNLFVLCKQKKFNVFNIALFITTYTTMNEFMQLSRLKKSDYNKGFLQLLEHLTIVEADKITYNDFCKQFDSLSSKIFVIRFANKIIATGSIFIEKKFIHNLASIGHIEDVVVGKEYRKIGLGKVIIYELIKHAKKSNCYKVILNCSDNNIKFYEKCGFIKKENEMAQYFSRK